jgi:hypothetical protein
VAAADIVAKLPPPDQLGKSESEGGMPPAVDAPPSDVDPGKAAALADFDAAAPGSPERVKAFDDAIYMCVMKLKAEGKI